MAQSYAGGRLLVATDFSDGAAAALLEARGLARPLGMTVLVLHVREPSIERPHPLERSWLDDLALDPADLATREGTAWIEIVRHAGEVSAAMIVVGAHGRSGRQPMQLGSTTARLLLKSTVPVLVVGAGTDEPAGSNGRRRQAMQDRR